MHHGVGSSFFRGGAFVRSGLFHERLSVSLSSYKYIHAMRYGTFTILGTIIDFVFNCGWKGWCLCYWRDSEWRDGQCICTHNFEAPSNNHCCASAVSTRYSYFVFVALVTQHAKRMRRIAFSSVTCPAVPYFSTLPHKRHDSREKRSWIWNVCFDFLDNCISNIFHSKKNWAICYYKFTWVFM
jgi:hypothetical protein